MVYTKKEHKKPEMGRAEAIYTGESEKKESPKPAPKPPAPEKMSDRDKLYALIELLANGCGDNGKYKALLNA